MVVVAVAAPAATVDPSPDTAIAFPPLSPPRLSWAAPSEAVSFAVWCWGWVPLPQPPPGCTNTYAAPCPAFAPMAASGAPAATVDPSPETAIEEPNRSFAAASDAVSVANCSVAPDQPPAGRAKT